MKTDDAKQHFSCPEWWCFNSEKEAEYADISLSRINIRRRKGDSPQLEKVTIRMKVSSESPEVAHVN